MCVKWWTKQNLLHEGISKEEWGVVTPARTKCRCVHRVLLEMKSTGNGSSKETVVTQLKLMERLYKRDAQGNSDFQHTMRNLTNEEH